MIYYTMMLYYLTIYYTVECSMHHILIYNRIWCARITHELWIEKWRFNIMMDDPITQCDGFVWRVNKEWYTICYTIIRTLPLDSIMSHTPCYNIYRHMLCMMVDVVTSRMSNSTQWMFYDRVRASNMTNSWYDMKGFGIIGCNARYNTKFDAMRCTVLHNAWSYKLFYITKFHIVIVHVESVAYIDNI